MPQVGWLVKNKAGEYKRVSHEKLLEYSKTYPKGFDYTPEMLEGMFRPFERDYISPTMLSGCNREVVLKRKLDYYVPLDHAWPAYRGTIGHAIMESGKNEPGAILERRLSCNFVLKPSGDNILIKGTPDKVLPDQKLLVDYKTVSEITGVPKGYWTVQLSAYRWMLLQHGIEIERAIIQQIGMMRPARLEIDMWPLRKTENWMNARITQFRGAFNGEFDLDKDILPPRKDFLTEPDVAWKCTGRGGKPAWCDVAEECLALWERGV